MGDELQFRAMGADAHVIVVGGHPTLAEQVRRRVDDLERRWSRFLPESEISALNRYAGAPLAVSADTALLVERSIDAWRLTDGAFDPTVLGDVIRAGYDRSFDELPAVVAAGDSDASRGCGAISIHGRAVQLPAGTGFDPGGIGKGLAADIVVEEVMSAGASGVCVNLGGDLRVAGVSPSGDGWTIAVAHPWTDEPLARVGIHDGAVATSTTLRRRWELDGESMHHLIDPSTGRPSCSDLTLVTVVAGAAWVAEVLAKAVLLRGSLRALDFFPVRAEALAVDGAGDTSTSRGLPAYLGDASVVARIRVAA
ncbi:MAG: thiamine biosynthesis lipoprotein ApbE [Actinomycetia bacterium]|jgi:thiamine biosynthesis lipoprotein|nr:thiamine biosynthesis lipoprotein ApbE [Actinomycetes bacterium]